MTMWRIRHNGVDYNVVKSEQGPYVAVDLSDESLELEDRQKFFVQGEEAERYLDMDNSDILDELDFAGVL